MDVVRGSLSTCGTFQQIEESFDVFFFFSLLSCGYINLYDKIYDLYDVISLLHLLIYNICVSSSYLVYQTQCSHDCLKDASL